MASSEINIDGVGKVKLFRRKGLKYIRVSIGHDGTLRLSLPWYVPKKVGVEYVLSKKDWINKHRNVRKVLWSDGTRLTKDYVLKIYTGDKIKSIQNSRSRELQVYLPSNLSGTEQQNQINKYIGEFIKNEAKKQLPLRLYNLAEKYGYKVKDVKIRKLKSRWGSCTNQKVISLNMMLVHVPEELCEYVLLHELAHTRHLNHGPKFWEEVSEKIPDYKEKRKALRKFNPAGII